MLESRWEVPFRVYRSTWDEIGLRSGAVEPHGTLGTRPNLILGNELPFPNI